MNELYSIMGLTPYRLFKLILCIGGLVAAIGSASPRQLLGGTPLTQHASDAPAPMPANGHSLDAQVPQTGPISQAATFNSETLTLSEKPFDLRRDWWKYSIMLLVLAVSGYYIVKAGAALLRLLCLIVCVTFSSFAAYIGGPLLEPFLAQNMPYLDLPQCPVRYWAYLVVFLVAYIVASMLIALIKKPLKAPPREKQGAKS